MARESRLDGDRRRLVVAHLSDENDVRVLTKGPLQRGGKSLGMKPHLPVVDNTALTSVDKFDGILNGDDMVLAVTVGLVNNGCQGGGFTGTGGSARPTGSTARPPFAISSIPPTRQVTVSCRQGGWG